MATQVGKLLIFQNGNFRIKIEEELKLDGDNSPLAVVSIIGAVSSGKSTLLNHMFGTKFEGMDAEKGRKGATKGIRIAKYLWNQRCILVIDTEGSDGKERKGDETFAIQTTIFAMAISRVVIINMMCTDIGRELGGGWPLLRTACEAMQRIKPRHQVMLLFVLRDKTDSSPEVLRSQITDEMEEIFKAQGNARLSELFKIEVVATSHYLIQTERPIFIAEVEKLREQIISHATSNENTSDSIPIRTSTFTTFARKIWVNVKKDKVLGLPSSTIMAAKKHCDRIADEQRERFSTDTSWIQIKENVESGSIIQGFGKDVSNLICTHVLWYYRCTEKVDETIRDERRERLIKELLEIIEPTYLHLVERMMRRTQQDFYRAAVGQLKRDGTLAGVEDQAFIDQFNHQVKDAYIEQAKWTHTSRQCKALQNHIDGYKQMMEGINACVDAQLDKLRQDGRNHSTDQQEDRILLADPQEGRNLSADQQEDRILLADQQEDIIVFADPQADRNLVANGRELRRSLWNQFACQCGNIGIRIMPLVVNAILKSFGLEPVPIHRF